MPRHKRSATVMVFNGKPMNRLELAAATGLSYYLLSDRYKSGDRDEDLIRPVGAPKKQKAATPKVIVRKDLGPFHQLPRRKINSAKAEARRAALERVQSEYLAAMTAPLINRELLTPDERSAIHQRIGSGLRWHGIDSNEQGKA